MQGPRKRTGPATGALPYMVTIDSVKGCVVLSLRGTLTLRDLVTDLVLEPVALESWLPPSFVEVTSPARQPLQPHLDPCQTHALRHGMAPCCGC